MALTAFLLDSTGSSQWNNEKKEMSMNTGKGDTKSSLFADNWLSDKKIQKNHLKTIQPEGEFTKISGHQVKNKHTVFIYTSNN